MVMAKGLSGGYLPLAITLISEKLFSVFDGPVAKGKSLAYGHSYTGNALASGAGKASLEVFANERVPERLQPKIRPSWPAHQARGNVIVLIPPLCIAIDQLNKTVEALGVLIAAVRDRSVIAAGKDGEETKA